MQPDKKCVAEKDLHALLVRVFQAKGLSAADAGCVADVLTWAELRGSNAPRPGPDYAGPAAPMYFNYRKTSIYAGSNEIQHNIMAKMVLGL